MYYETKFPDVIEKVAKKRKEREWTGSDKLVNVGAGLGTGIGVNAATRPLRINIQDKILDNVDAGPKISPRDLGKVHKAMGVPKGVRIKPSGSWTEPGEGPHYMPSSPVSRWLYKQTKGEQGTAKHPHVQAPMAGGPARGRRKKSVPNIKDMVNWHFGRTTRPKAAPRTHDAAITAHEFGHAVNRKKLIAGALQRARAPGLLTARAAGLTAMLADPDSKKSRYSTAAVAAGHLPTLIEEAIASHRAMKGLRASGTLSEAGLKASRKQLQRAWNTYGAGAGAAVLGTEAVRRTRKWLKKKQLED